VLFTRLPAERRRAGYPRFCKTSPCWPMAAISSVPPPLAMPKHRRRSRQGVTGNVAGNAREGGTRSPWPCSAAKSNWPANPLTALKVEQTAVYADDLGIVEPQKDVVRPRVIEVAPKPVGCADPAAQAQRSARRQSRDQSFPRQQSVRGYFLMPFLWAILFFGTQQARRRAPALLPSRLRRRSRGAHAFRPCRLNRIRRKFPP